jgi:hypothetical protein
MSLAPITLSGSQHRFFHNLATAQAATAAYFLGSVIQRGGTPTPFVPGITISQVCYTKSIEVVFEPKEILDGISNGRWPATIQLMFQVSSGRPSTATANLTTVQLLMGSLYEHAFIAYFENNRPAIKKRYGRVSNWPSVLNFGRIVRNAFAHGGTIDIRDSTSETWNGLSYSQSANGRQILYNDLSSGDLTLLMIEMDAAF